MQYLKDLFKNFVGPALFAAVLILGWWAYSDIETKKQRLVQDQTIIETLVQQRDELSLALKNQCRQLLERQGFSVLKFDPPAEKK